MRIRRSRAPKPRLSIRKHQVFEALPALAVVFTVASLPLCLKAQNPPQTAPQGPTSAQSASTTTTPAAPTLSPDLSDGYPINPDDVLDVYVYGVPELSREYAVTAAGTVNMPLLPKPIQAAGLSPEQFARSLEENFRESGRLSRPQITVAVRQSRRSVVTVDGAVKSPQAVPVMGRTRLLSVLSECGGRADDAGSTITVSRGELAMHDLSQEGEPASPTTIVEFKKLMDGNDPASKFDVWPGDRVSVEQAGLFYVLGQVNRPGGYNLKSAQEQVTVLEAFAIAGDITPIAKADKTMIIRKNAKAANGREEIGLNVKDILYGRSPDRVLQADDILYVPVSGGKRAMRGAGAIATTVAGAAGAAAIYTRF
ncbi:MAG TPA: polysaccharide biosynthesis/export family protein [Terriglobia bacterium]|nr:polysaccharide biosynthesis/export family protein [Terriglobia bacterium]